MAQNVHQHVKLADLEIERGQCAGEFTHHRAFSTHQRNPVAKTRIVPGQGRRKNRRRGGFFVHAVATGLASIGWSLSVAYSRPADKSSTVMGTGGRLPTRLQIKMVRTTGLEPVLSLRSRFSYHFDFRRRLLAFVVWTVPSPWPESFRRRPSSLYTFPEAGLGSGLAWGTCPLAFPDFERFYSADFPAGTPVLKSAASTDFATSAFCRRFSPQFPASILHLVQNRRSFRFPQALCPPVPPRHVVKAGRGHDQAGKARSAMRRMNVTTRCVTAYCGICPTPSAISRSRPAIRSSIARP